MSCPQKVPQSSKFSGWIYTILVPDKISSSLEWGFSGGACGEKPAYECRRHRRCRFNQESQEDPLEACMAAHPNILVGRTPWTEEPAQLQSIVSHRVRHDWGNLAQPWIRLFKKFCILYTLSFLQQLWRWFYSHIPGVGWRQDSENENRAEEVPKRNKVKWV